MCVCPWQAHRQADTFERVTVASPAQGNTTGRDCANIYHSQGTMNDESIQHTSQLCCERETPTERERPQFASIGRMEGGNGTRNRVVNQRYISCITLRSYCYCFVDGRSESLGRSKDSAPFTESLAWQSLQSMEPRGQPVSTRAISIRYCYFDKTLS